MVGNHCTSPVFANIYSGTSTGKITDLSPTLIGSRIVKDDQFGTIKYVGPISNSKVIWLGIDWDDPEYGRHDGSFRDTKYFNAHHQTSGTFLKPEKASLGVSLEEALVTHYVLCVQCQPVAKNPNIFQAGSGLVTNVTLESATAGYIKANLDLSGTDSQYIENEVPISSVPFTVEIFTKSEDTANHALCGSKGVANKLPRLRFVSVRDMPVFRGLKANEKLEDDVLSLWPECGHNLAQYLSALRDLDISRCLLSTWVEVASICDQLPMLEKLNVGFNYLRLPRTKEDELSNIPESQRRLILDIDSDVQAAENLCSSAFRSLSRLVLVHMPSEEDGFRFRWSEITRILSWMPSLKEICLAYNELGDLPDPSSDLGSRLTPLLLKLTEVDLTSTGSTDFSRIIEVLGDSTSLKNLILCHNKISIIRFPVNRAIFPNLEMLTLKDNLINDWESVNELNRLPTLAHLILFRNRIVDSISLETARQELIARLPRLKILNRQDIERDEKRGAELDFLKRYGKEWLDCEKLGEEAKLEFERKYPTFQALCDKHGAPDHGETKTVIRTLKEGLVEVILSCEPQFGITSEVRRQIPTRMTVNHLRALARRLFKLSSTAKIDLVAVAVREGFEDVEVPLDSDTREIGFFGIESGDRLVSRWSSE